MAYLGSRDACWRRFASSIAAFTIGTSLACMPAATKYSEALVKAEHGYVLEVATSIRGNDALRALPYALEVELGGRTCYFSIVDDHTTPLGELEKRIKPGTRVEVPSRGWDYVVGAEVDACAKDASNPTPIPTSMVKVKD